MEAYIAALYFSFPPATRAVQGWTAVDSWLREMYEPLYEFFYNRMKSEYEQHHSATGAGADGVIINNPEMAVEDAKSQGMAALLGMFCGKRGIPLAYREERLETNIGVLWKVKVDVAGTEMAEATRASKKVAKNVGAWTAARGLGITVCLLTVALTNRNDSSSSPPLSFFHLLLVHTPHALPIHSLASASVDSPGLTHR